MWKEINGYEGYYEINEYGDVRNIKTGKILSPGIRSGYKFVVLCRNGSDHQKHNVHRLVATHFVENPNNYPMVMHKDNNKLNCYYTNLKCGTAQENTIQAHKDGLCIDKRQIYDVYKDNEDDVVCIGMRAVLDLIGSNSKSLGPVLDKVKNNRTISEGPYKGYRVRKLTKGVIYD